MRGATNMIQSLFFKNFGKFKNQRFETGRFNLIQGPNEAGKSTFFDALFSVIARPGKNRKEGKALYERYELSTEKPGDRLEAEWERDWENDAAIPVEDFMSVYSLQGSNVALSLDQSSDWMNRLKNELFSGGMDPSAIEEQLKKNYTEFNRNTKQKRERNEATSRLDALEKKDSTLENTRNQLLQKKKQIEQNSDQEKKSAAEIQRFKEKISELEQTLNREEQIAYKNKLKELYLLIQNEESLQKEFQALSAFQRDETGALDQKEGALQKLEHQKLQVEVEANHLSRTIEELQKSHEQKEAEQTTLSSKLSLLQELKETLENHRLNPPVLSRTIHSPGRIALAASLFGAGLVAFALGIIAGISGSFSTAGMILPFALSIPLTGAGIFIFTKARRIERSTDYEQLQVLVNRMKDRWQKLTGERPIQESLEGMIDEIQAMEARRNHLIRTLEEGQKEISAKNRVLAEKKEYLSQASMEAENLRQQIQSWFQERNVKNRDHYLEMRSAASSMGEKIQETQLRIEAISIDKSLDRFALKAECSRKLEMMDRENIADEGISYNKKEQLKRELDEARRQLQDQTNRSSALRSTISESSGELRVEMQRLGEEMVHTREEIQKTKARLASIELDRQAAEYAIFLLKTIQDETGNLFKKLGQDLTESFGGFFPEIRSVHVEDLREDKISIQDSGGTVRPLAHLSSGTRDAFVFATRLAFLARVGNPDKAPLVCDDPFLTLDPDRVEKGLQMLHNFQERTGYQIFFFTKDPYTGKLIEKLWKDVKTIDLESIPQ